MKPNGPTFDKAWSESCEVRVAARSEVEPMIRRHYLGRWPGVVVLILAMARDGMAVGVIVFALPPRETAKRYGGVTWELARLWIADEVPANAETFLIARAIRHIKRHRPEVCVIVSYADPSVGHQGTIYRAANFTAEGRTDGERKTPRFDYVDATTAKHYSRRSHVPTDAEIIRVPRVSKWRYVYRLKAAA
jgi:hypothetical protein